MCYCDLKEQIYFSKRVDMDFMTKSFFAMRDTMTKTPLYEDGGGDSSDEEDIFHFRNVASHLGNADDDDDEDSVTPEEEAEVIQKIMEYERVSFFGNFPLTSRSSCVCVCSVLRTADNSFVSVFGLCLSAIQVEHVPHLNCTDWVSIRVRQLTSPPLFVRRIRNTDLSSLLISNSCSELSTARLVCPMRHSRMFHYSWDTRRPCGSEDRQLAPPTKENPFRRRWLCLLHSTAWFLPTALARWQCEVYFARCTSSTLSNWSQFGLNWQKRFLPLPGALM